MKPNQFNTHGSRSKRTNPKTGFRYDYETEQLALHAEENARMEVEKAVSEELALLERQQVAMAAREHLLPFTKFTMPDPANPGDVKKSVYEPARFHELIADDLTAFINGEIRNSDGSVCKQLIFCMPPRHGKSISHETPILTPDGWRKHGDLRAGDRVFGPDGLPTLVLHTSEDVDEVVPITFSNGETVRCHLNHEWTVFDRAQRAGKQWRNLETREIAKRALRNGPAGVRGGRWTLQLPDTDALQFPPKDLPIHPYFLGAWLGDGHHKTAVISHAASDIEVISSLKSLGYAPCGQYVQLNTGVHYARFAGVRGKLKSLGVFGNKHIPEAYLRSSTEQRLELLAGLVDTDGHVEARSGRVRFSTCSVALRDGVYELATTLGFRPYVIEAPPVTSSSGIVGKKTVYQVGFQPTCEIPTRIPRKRISKFAVRRRVGIVSVGPVEKGGARSICVDRDDGLYLVGKTCLPTHNTQLGTKSLTAWVSGKRPEWDIGVASYSDSMAQDMGADTRAIMQTPQFKQVFPNHRLRKGGTAKDNIQTEAGGRLVFVGRGGALTGRGMSLGLGDDLLKDHEEARSQAIRDSAWNWFTKVFMTRRMGPKLIILTMTRWHEDDVIGRITDPNNPHYNAIEAAKWKIIRLPAIAEDDDPLGRAPGEPLWPERFDLDFLQSQQRIDPLGFAALYQQTPTVADGTVFRRENIQRYDMKDLPENLRFYAASDHAVGTKQRNDPSCFGKGGVDPQGNLWMTELFWQRAPADKAVEMMLEMGCGFPVDQRPLVWWAERGHISKSIGPFLQKRMQETNRFLRVQEVTPIGDKEQRAQSIAARVAVGKVFFPKGPIWDKAIEEMLAFPNGLHDDVVDMLSLFGLGLTSQFGKSAPVVKKVPKFGTLEWLKMEDKRAADMANRNRYGGF